MSSVLKLLLYILVWTPFQKALGFVVIQSPAAAQTTTYSSSYATTTKVTTCLSAKSSSYKPNVPNFCSECGSSNMGLKIPDDDDHLRAVCEDCGAVVYVNPKVVVSCVVILSSSATTKDQPPQVLLGQRAIEPRKGYWGIPQGYMELDETTREAVCREVWEETGATISTDQLRFRGLYNVPGSVQLVYSMTISDKENITISQSTTESTAIEFFPIDSLPELCFPTVQWAIDHCVSSISDKTIQQKNKLYDPESGVWSESEDMDAI